jgi:hypothetical protein
MAFPATLETQRPSSNLPQNCCTVIYYNTLQDEIYLVSFSSQELAVSSKTHFVLVLKAFDLLLLPS